MSYETSQKDRAYIDVRLKKLNALNATYVGTDTTDRDRREHKRLAKPLIQEIKARDEYFYNTTFKIHPEI